MIYITSIYIDIFFVMYVVFHGQNPCRNRGLGCEIDALPYVTGLQAPHVEVQHVYHYNVHQAFRCGGGADDDDDDDDDDDEPFLGRDVCHGLLSFTDEWV